MKYILITGVSTGIGYAAAEELVQRGYHVFGSVRKEADGARVQAELGDQFTPLLFDVTDHEGVTTAVATITDAISPNGLYALINNAGISTPGPLMHMPLDEFRWQLEVNATGLLDVTQQCLPLLGATKNPNHPPGRIINISSVSGKIVYPFMGAYAASKHAVEAMSDALRRELMIYGIEVIIIEPGTVKTPIVGKFAEQVAQYASTDYAQMLSAISEGIAERERTAMPVDKITRVIVEAVETATPKARYAVPRKMLSGWLIPRLLPDRWFDRMIANKLK